MAQNTLNPRFPHTCRVYRLEGASSFSKGEEKELYKGQCRKSSSDNIRTFNTGSSTTGKVDSSDYRVSIPAIVRGLQKGDLVDVETLCGTETKLRVVNINPTPLLGDSTEIMCNLPSS